MYNSDNINVYNKFDDDKKILVFIPTYNEKENVQNLVENILNLNINLDILFLDDNSPDGTGDVLNDIAKQYQNIFVIHRPMKLGIGSAHQYGIQWAYDRGYKILITMDADFTHSPEYIRDLLEKEVYYDLVVASRYIRDDSLEGWNFLRKSLTIIGHFFTKYILGINEDATGAFRLYKLDRIPSHAFKLVSSKGYSFFFESLYILKFNHFSIGEISIKLPPRTYGNSKMKFSDAWHSVCFLFAIYLTTLFNKEKFVISDPFVAHDKSFLLEYQCWNAYWQNQKTSGGLIYDALAAFYRKFIIKRALNYFAKKYLKKGANVLHAGCGSGQVDTDLHDYCTIIAMDISVNALSLYKKVNKGCGKLLHGSVINIPILNDSLDGVYNLGVMEHFEIDNIRKILGEFYRVLKPGGCVIIFWPPNFGISVLVLKLYHFLMQNFFKKKVKLHPDEINLLQSKKQAISIFENAGFLIKKCYFGVKDMFTHIVIIAEKPTTSLF